MMYSVEAPTVFDNPMGIVLLVVSQNKQDNWALRLKDLTFFIEGMKQLIPKSAKAGEKFSFIPVDNIPSNFKLVFELQEPESDWHCGIYQDQSNSKLIMACQEGDQFWRVQGPSAAFQHLLQLLEKGLNYLQSTPPRDISPWNSASLTLLTDRFQPARFYISVKVGLFSLEESPIEMIYEYAEGGMSWEFSIAEIEQCIHCIENFYANRGFNKNWSIRISEWMQITSNGDWIKWAFETEDPNQPFFIAMSQEQLEMFFQALSESLEIARSREYYIFQSPEPGNVHLGKFEVGDDLQEM